MADLRGATDVGPPLGPIFFNIMQFSGKVPQISSF